MTTAGHYCPVPDWPSVPHGQSFCGNANAVAVDSEDLVYVFNRGTLPVAVFDANGAPRGGWGVGEFDRPHGIFVDVDDHLWLVDVAGHYVQKRTREGEILLTIGERGRPGRSWSGEPFNQPTDVAVHPDTGDVFIGDGYCNSHIHKYDAEGRHIKTWGGPGDKPGQLSNPHGLCLLGNDTLVVCDRENYRLQIFSLDGDVLDQWHVHRPCAIRAARDGSCIYVAELGPTPQLYGKVLNMGNRVSVRAADGGLLAELGQGEPGLEPDQFAAPHGVAIDSRGDVYVAEVTGVVYEFMGKDLLVEPVSMRKWHRAAAVV